MPGERVSVSCCTKTFMLACPFSGCTYTCTKLFKSPSSLQIHLRNKHGVKRKSMQIFATKCPCCPYRVVDREELRQHMKAMHPLEKMPSRS